MCLLTPYYVLRICMPFLDSSVTSFLSILDRPGRKDRGLGQDSPKQKLLNLKGESIEPRPGKESTTRDSGGVDRGRNRSLSRVLSS